MKINKSIWLCRVLDGFAPQKRFVLHRQLKQFKSAKWENWCNRRNGKQFSWLTDLFHFCALALARLHSRFFNLNGCWFVVFYIFSGRKSWRNSTELLLAISSNFFFNTRSWSSDKSQRRRKNVAKRAQKKLSARRYSTASIASPLNCDGEKHIMKLWS